MNRTTDAADDLPTLHTLDELAECIAREPALCVRYSKGPDDDAGRTSIDYESGLELPGVSTNPLRPEPWWTRDVRDWLARQISHYAHLNENGRRAWVLVGSVAGSGPDREPLLDPWRPVAWLGDALIDEAGRRYAERFDVGQDSRSA